MTGAGAGFAEEGACGSRGLLTIGLILPLLARAEGPRVVGRTEVSPGVWRIEVHSAAIASGTAVKDPKVTLSVVLPPSYGTAQDRRYPVVYFLPGFMGYPAEVNDWAKVLGKAFAAGGKEFIVAGVEGRTPSGGSFYLNGVATGGWEDWVVKEAVAVVDQEFRTLARRDSRGLSGLSMGGFGALNLGLKHPDVYGSVFAVGPAVAPPGWIRGFASAPEPQILKAYGEVVSPTAAGQARIPTWDGTAEDARIGEAWDAGIGRWPEKVAAYQALNRPLAAVHVEVGTEDPFVMVREGVHYLGLYSEAKRLGWEVIDFPGAHELSLGGVSKRLAPFFLQHLAFQAP